MSSQPTSIEGINRLLATKAQTDPREALRIREQLIASGVKGTTLTLGTVSPAVISALERQRDIQQFPERKAELQAEIDILKSEGRVATVNTSELSRDEARQRAKQIFTRQQATTLGVTQEVRDVLASSEFQQIKARGGSSQELADLLNKRGIVFNKQSQAVINELSQADIQGEQQTAQNIENILARDGIQTPVRVTIDDSPVGASFQVGESAQPIVQPIINILGGATTEGLPTQDGQILLLGQSPVIPPQVDEAGVITEPQTNIIADIGRVINELLGLDINPLVTGIFTAFIPIFIILVAI